MGKPKSYRHNNRKKQQKSILYAIIGGGVLLLLAAFAIGRNALANRADSGTVKVSGQPSLQVDRELIDYGDVKLDTNLTFKLKLTNVGDEKLAITGDPYVEVKEGC
jgi:hypothetical protein